MPLAGKKLGLLISVGPDHPNFRHGLRLAETALERGLHVYLYCIDEAVRGVPDVRLQELRARGLHLFACAYGAQRRHLPHNDLAVYSGLTVLNDLMANTDRFLSLN